jgi:SAM-dependent methyltransferase
MSTQVVIPRSSLRLPLAGQSSLPRGKLPICKLCDLADWASPSFLDLAADITGWSLDADFRHRKAWEFVQTVRALRAQDLLDERAIGLSVAAGREALLFYLANHVGRIVATDIYGEGHFASREADRLFLTDQQRFAPFAYRADRLKVLSMNALALHFADNAFDFVYSLSSIEHFGGVAAAIQALREMVRVVKPGGLVFITTECAVNGLVAQDVFGLADIERLANECGAELIEPIDYGLSDLTLQTLVDFNGDLNTLPHINLIVSGAIFTSISLAFRKPTDSKTESDEQRNAPLLQSDWSLLDADLEDIRSLLPYELVTLPAVRKVRYLAGDSPFTRLPLIGSLWNWIRRPLHELICFYVNQQAESQIAEINGWLKDYQAMQTDRVLGLRRRLRRLEKRESEKLTSDKDS